MRHGDRSLHQPRQLLARVGRGLRGVARLSSDAVLVGALRAFLVLCYALVCYIVVLAIAGLIVPVTADLSTPAPWWLNIVALLIIGLSIVPIDRWIHGRVDELIYSWPDDPYKTLSRVHADLARASSPNLIIAEVAATIAATLKLPYVAITPGPQAATVSSGTPPPGCERLSIPLAYSEAVVGSLEVAARRPGSALSASELQLLNDLARQVGITLHAAQLSEALQSSRAQLVAAREEERRRIRRDLHDGLGPTLASMRLQLGAARRTLRTEPDLAEALLDELRADVSDATAAIRRLVYDLRPPLLDEHGLAGALQSLSRLIEPEPLRLELPAALPALPAAVEVAIYRIAAEALLNAARHAHASGCTLALDVSEELVQLRVSDKGVGLSREHRDGVGLSTMRERAEELAGSLCVESLAGAGVTVIARIPRKAAP